jgi:acetyl esterase
MERKYSKELYEKIESRQYTVTENGVEVLVKPLPDTDVKGMPEPGIAKLMQSKRWMLSLFSKAIEDNLIKHPEKIARKSFNKVKSIPIVDSVETTELTVNGKAGAIPVRIFLPKEHGENLPVFYYIHGGGFFAGSAECESEGCRLVCEKLGCVGVTLDYRLAPKNPFPAGLDDCYSVLEWTYANIEKYHGDKNKICISGDSAGGNLAAVCALKNRDENKNMVAAQALMYPTLNIARKEDEFCHYSDTYIYDKAPGYEKGIEQFIKFIGNAMNLMPLVLKTDKIDTPYVTPYMANLKGLPPCVIIYGEFDFLRIEDEAYARKLISSGVPARLVRFSGLSHGFIDQIGVEPQAEICVSEICKFMEATLGAVKR